MCAGVVPQTLTLPLGQLSNRDSTWRKGGRARRAGHARLAAGAARAARRDALGALQARSAGAANPGRACAAGHVGPRRAGGARRRARRRRAPGRAASLVRYGNSEADRKGSTVKNIRQVLTPIGASALACTWARGVLYDTGLKGVDCEGGTWLVTVVGGCVCFKKGPACKVTGLHMVRCAGPAAAS